MAKRTSTEATETIAAPKKTEFKKAVKAYLAHKEKTSDEAKGIVNSVEHVHAGVFKTIARLDNMDAVKRGEWLFHFDIEREFYDWLKAEPSLGLSDRAAGGDDAKSNEDEVDLRPRHLKQPGASVTSDAPPRGSASVTQLSPPKRGVKEAADAAEKEKNLSNVGRGPVTPDPNSKH